MQKMGWILLSGALALSLAMAFGCAPRRRSGRVAKAEPGETEKLKRDLKEAETRLKAELKRIWEAQRKIRALTVRLSRSGGAVERERRRWVSRTASLRQQVRQLQRQQKALNQQARKLILRMVKVRGLLKTRKYSAALNMLKTAAKPGTVQWKTKIGLTTYRSTIHFYKNKIVVNSNGASLKSTSDKLDGVYIIDPTSGRVLRKIVPPGSGQKDCNGVGLGPKGLYFGTDQPAFYHYNWKGRMVWKATVKGDPESPPAIVDLNGDRVPDAVFGTDTGYVYALNGKNGRPLWSFRTGRGGYSQQSIYAAPAVLVRGRKVTVFIAARDQKLYAVDGQRGKVLWSIRAPTALRASPLLADTNRNRKVEVIFGAAYGRLYVADALTGKVRWSRDVVSPGRGPAYAMGLYASMMWHPTARCVLVATAWWQNREVVNCEQRNRTVWRHTEFRGNITSTAVVGDVSGDGVGDAVFGTESGYLVAMSHTGRRIFRQRLGGAVEISPLIADVDGDGVNEVFVADKSGMLYRIATGGKGKPAAGYWRINPQNHGRLK